jgi:hypothetical protein
MSKSVQGNHSAAYAGPSFRFGIQGCPDCFSQAIA